MIDEAYMSKRLMELINNTPANILSYYGEPMGNLLVQDETVLSAREQAHFRNIVVQFVNRTTTIATPCGSGHRTALATLSLTM